MTDRQIAEVFHPGEFLRDEMKARGWSIETLTEKSLLRRDYLEELLAEHRKVTPVIAHCLGVAFGTSKEFWMNLQSSWDDRKVSRE